MTDVSLRIDDQWRARRIEDGSWYYYHRTTKETLWTYQSHFDWTNAELDERWLAEKAASAAPGGTAAPLPPASEKAKQDSEFVARSRTLRRRHGLITQLEPALPSHDDTMVTSNAWVQTSLGINAAAEKAINTQIAHAILASKPSSASAVGKSKEALEEWYRLVATAAKPDAVMEPEIRQLLSTSTHVLGSESSVDMTALRTALGQVMDMSYSGASNNIKLYNTLLSKYTAASEKQTAAIFFEQSFLFSCV